MFRFDAASAAEGAALSLKSVEIRLFFC